MSNFNDPSVQHTNTVQQILDVRERAHKAVSLARKVTLSTTHPNLAATDGGRDADIASDCSQALVDYLLHLRPYRGQSQNWNIDLGALALPESIQDDSANGGWDSGKTSHPLYLCRQPQVRLAGLSDVIEAVNSTVMYSSNREVEASMNPVTKNKVETESGELVVENRRLFHQLIRGETTVDELADRLGPDERDRICYMYDYGDEWRFYAICKEIDEAGSSDEAPHVVDERGDVIDQYGRGR